MLFRYILGQSNVENLRKMGVWESDPSVRTLKQLSVLEWVEDEEIERVKGLVASNAVRNLVDNRMCCYSLG